jgi:hypothetical protein
MLAIASRLVAGAFVGYLDLIDEKRESLGVSAIARSCESEIPCLSSAGPPLLQRLAPTQITNEVCNRRT